MNKLKIITKVLWTAADSLRITQILTHHHKGYLLRLLLFKRLSDRSEEALDQQAQDDLSVYIPPEVQWNKIQNIKKDIGDHLERIFYIIEDENPLLREILTNPSFSSWQQLSDEVLEQLIWCFSQLNLKDSYLNEADILGLACENLLEDFAIKEGKIGGESITPHEVTQLLVRLISPKEGMRICDPACGFGSLLVESARQVEQQSGNLQRLSLYGQEINRESFAIAKINLLLHDIYNFDLHLGDTLRNPKFIQDGQLMQFDRVTLNPAFNISNWGVEEAKFDSYNRFRFGIPPGSSGNLAFIQHILATLNNQGVASVLQPLGVLFHSGSEQDIRRKILEKDLVESVIVLAPNLLYGSSISSVILVFNKHKQAHQKGKVLFIDASEKFEPQSKRKNMLTQDDIDWIVEAHESFKDIKEGVKIASLEEIAENDYDLSPYRYITSSQDKIDFKAEIKELKKNLRIAENKRNEAEEEIIESLNALGVKIP